MKPTRVLDALKHMYAQRQPTFIWGPPGGGKSAIVKQLCADLKIGLRDVRLSLMDPTDIKGFPVLNGTGTKKQLTWAPPDFLPTKGEGVLFLDEMNSAPQATQAASYQLMTDRRIGDYELPPGWAVFAAGNRAGDRAVVSTQPSALANRFVHIDFDTDLDDWNAWALRTNAHDHIRGFIRFRPDALHAFDPVKNERAFPSPRSWSFVDKILQAKLEPVTQFELIKGTIGEGAAVEFAAFMELAKDLPTVDEVLMQPTKAPIPTSPSGKYAICMALTKAATKNTLPGLLQYVERLPPDYQVVFMSDALIADRSLASTRPYIDWITKNPDLVGVK